MSKMCGYPYMSHAIYYKSSQICVGISVWVMSYIKSHLKCVWVSPNENESCHTYMSHVKYVWVSPNENSSLSRMNELLQICVGIPSLFDGRWHLSVCMSRMNEPRHIWMSHVTHMNEPCQVCVGIPGLVDGRWHLCVCMHVTYAWALSHIWMS